MDFETSLKVIEVVPVEHLEKMVKASILNVNVKSANGYLLTRRCKDYKKFRFLVNNGCPVFSLSDDKYLTLASMDFLVKYIETSDTPIKIDCSIKSKRGSTILHILAHQPVYTMMLILKCNLINLDINAKDNDGNTFLNIICASGAGSDESKVELIKRLLALGADYTIPNNMGRIPSDYCSKNILKAMLGVATDNELRDTLYEENKQLKKKLQNLTKENKKMMDIIGDAMKSVTTMNTELS